MFKSMKPAMKLDDHEERMKQMLAMLEGKETDDAAKENMMGQEDEETPEEESAESPEEQDMEDKLGIEKHKGRLFGHKPAVHIMIALKGKK